MAFDVKFYTAAQFKKRTNSTKQPASNLIPAATYQCTLKDNTGLAAPTIRLKLANTGGAIDSPADFAYCHIPAFNRYYYMRDYVNAGPLWELQLVSDPLASFKADIGASSRYILRAASETDGSIIDNIYPAIGGKFQERTGAAAPFLSYGNGSFVLGIIGGGTDSASMGAVQYYAFTQAQLVAFFNALFGNASWTGVQADVLDTELQKMVLNPFQYIASAMFFPFDCTSLSGAAAVTSLKFGWWSLPVGAYKLPKVPQYTVNATDIAVHKHPQAAARGGYLNLSPYSDYIFKLQPFGEIPLDSTMLYNAAYLSFDIGVDLISGIGRLGLVTLDGSGNILKYLPEHMAQIGVPIELAQISRDVMTPLSNAVSAGISAAIGDIGGAIMNSISAVASSIGATFGNVERQGANGSMAAYMPSYPSMYHSYFMVADQSLAELGAPLCKQRTISTLSGYVLCADGDIDLAATEGERSQIAAYLTGGFYYE